MSVRWQQRLGLAVVLVLAAYLRLNHLGWAEFKLDEANLSRLSLNLVHGVEFPLTGIGSSAGIVNPPLAAWLLAIPYAVSPDPTVATGFVAALNVLAVLGCYLLARRWLTSDLPINSSIVAIAPLVAALLFAVAPWAVAHSRKIWAQNLLPPFVIAWAWSGWLAFVCRRPRAMIGHALTLAACVQLHYSALWLIPVTLLWSIVFIRRIQWKSALAGAAVFVLAFAPFLVADIVRGGASMTRFLEVARQPALIDDQAVHMAWLMVTGQEIHSLAGPQEFENYLAGVPGGEVGFGLTAITGVLVLAGGLVALIDVIQAARRRAFDDRSAVSFMMITWLAVPVLLQSRHSLPVFLHYFIILYPVPFLLVGKLVQTGINRSSENLPPRHHPAGRRGASGTKKSLGILSVLVPSWLVQRPFQTGSQRFKLAGGAVLLVAVLAIALLQAAQSMALQQFVAARTTPGGYGAPIEMTKQVASEAVRVSRQTGGAEVLIYTDGDDPSTREAPAIFDVLLPPDVPRRFVDLTQGTEVYPRAPAVVVGYAPAGFAFPAALDAHMSDADAGATIPLRAGEAPAQVRLWSGQPAGSAPCDSAAVLGRWSNGVTLLDATVSGDWIRLCYRVDGDASKEDYHWFNHVLGPDDTRWAQIDGAGYRASSWRQGDVIVIRFGPLVLPDDVPAGLYSLRVGMYTYPAGVNVQTIDLQGNPVGDSVLIDLGELTR